MAGGFFVPKFQTHQKKSNRKSFLIFAPSINPSDPARERTEEAGTGGSVYQRSQTGRPGKEESWVEAGAGAENGKCAIVCCIGICKQVGKAAARR